MVNKPLIRPYFWGGTWPGGGWLTSHNPSCTEAIALLILTWKFVSSRVELPVAVQNRLGMKPFVEMVFPAH